jgi:hypothetical protein
VVDHAVTTSAGAGTSKGAHASPGTVVPNPPSNGGYGFASNPDVTMVVGDQPLTPLQRRTVGNIQLRLFTAPNAGESCTPNSVQCIPPWCESTSTLVAEVSNDAMATVQAGSIIGLAQGSQVSLLNSFVVGAAEHSPVLLVMVKVADGIGHIRLTADGRTDTAAPVQGLAVLAVPNSTGDGTIALLDTDGRPHGSLELPQQSTVETPECALEPVPLPKAGKQPSDPADAERAVRTAYEKAFTAVPGDDSYSSLSAVQNGDALHAALDQLRHNFAQAAASSSVDTGQLVFTDPQTAVLKFTLHYTGGAPYGTHNGTAVFENGRWLVSQDSYCAVLGFGGARCPG